LSLNPLDEAERDLVSGFAIGGDAVPVALDHAGEALVGFEALPFEALSPVLEKAPGPARVTIVPELVESLLVTDFWAQPPSIVAAVR